MTIHTVEFEKPLINPDHEALRNAIREVPARRIIYDKPHPEIALILKDMETEYKLQTLTNDEGNCIGLMSILSPDNCRQEAILSVSGMRERVLSQEKREEALVLIDASHPMYKIETVHQQNDGKQIRLHAVIFYRPNEIREQD